MQEGHGAEWNAGHGVRFQGHSYRASIEDGDLVLYRSLGFQHGEDVRWPLESLAHAAFQGEGVAYKDGAFIPIPRGVLEFQAGRSLVRLEGRPEELARAFEIVSRAAHSAARRAPSTRPKAQAEPAPGSVWMQGAPPRHPT